MINQSNEIMVEKILDRLKRVAVDSFCPVSEGIPTRCLVIDNLYSEIDLPNQIYAAFDLNSSAWREMNSFREKKLTSKQFDKVDQVLKDITFALQDQRVVERISELTGIKSMEADPSLYAGGLSIMRKKDFLNPHIDNSHNQERSLYRRLNLLYYVTPNWRLEDGGHLELWDKKVFKNHVIESRFNRLVIMETNATSWHSVSPVVEGVKKRCCVSNYYFSAVSPTGDDYYHVTSFSARPEQSFRRVVSLLDGRLRSSLRAIKRGGFGKDDLYKPKN